MKINFFILFVFLLVQNSNHNFNKNIKIFYNTNSDIILSNYFSLDNLKFEFDLDGFEKNLSKIFLQSIFSHNFFSNHKPGLKHNSIKIELNKKTYLKKVKKTKRKKIQKINSNLNSNLNSKFTNLNSNLNSKKANLFQVQKYKIQKKSQHNKISKNKVCGINNKTYLTPLAAKREKMPIFYKGECCPKKKKKVCSTENITYENICILQKKKKK